jgi:hypothetical protein
MIGAAEVPALSGAASRAATTIAAPAVAGTVETAGVQAVTRTVEAATVQTVRSEAVAVATQAATRAPLAPAVGTIAGESAIETAGHVARTQIAGAEEINVSAAEYARLQQSAFIAHALNPVLGIVDEVGRRAAQRAVNDPRFVAAVTAENWTLAGTLFHSAAATEVRALSAAEIPAGWRLTAEEVVQAGLGGSRVDVLARGPAGWLLEFDWKTTGRSALTSAARREMQRHSGHITANIAGQLTGQESRSWIDYVRPLLPNIDWP